MPRDDLHAIPEVLQARGAALGEDAQRRQVEALPVAPIDGGGGPEAGEGV